MNPREPGDRSGRETRLLILVIVVSVGVLLLLARFRFPDAERTDLVPAPGALDRLTARAALDDVGGTVAEVVGRVSPWVVPVPLMADDGRERWQPALRLRPDLALVLVPDGLRVIPAGDPDAAGSLVGADPERSLGAVRVAPLDVGQPPAMGQSFAGFAWVAALEAGPGVVSARPVFIGRADELQGDRWPGPVFKLAGRPDLIPGDLIFTLGGQFVGLIVRDEEALCAVSLPALEAMVAAMAGEGDSRSP